MARSGTVSDDQLDWLRGIAEADDRRPLVIAVHHNALPTGVPWLNQYMRMANGDAFHAGAAACAGDRIRGVFYGHIHQNSQIIRDGILYSSVLSSWYQIHCWPGQTETSSNRTPSRASTSSPSARIRPISAIIAML